MLLLLWRRLRGGNARWRVSVAFAAADTSGTCVARNGVHSAAARAEWDTSSSQAAWAVALGGSGGPTAVVGVKRRANAEDSNAGGATILLALLLLALVAKSLRCVEASVVVVVGLIVVVEGDAKATHAGRQATLLLLLLRFRCCWDITKIIIITII